MNASELRSLARGIRTGLRDADGRPNTLMTIASKLGCASSALDIAASNLEYGLVSTAAVVARIRQVAAELDLDAEAYVQGRERVADAYEQRAVVLEQSRRIRVEQMTGDPQANEVLDGYETTISAFLAKNGDRFQIHHEDLAGLDVGEHFTYRDADGCQSRVTRLPEVSL